MSVLGKKILTLFNRPSKRQKSDANLVPFEKATHIGILYTWADTKKEEVLQSFVNEISEGKQVNILCFNTSKTAISTENPVFDESILTSFGKLNSEEVQRFIKTPHDYLFHFDFESDEIIKSILVQTKAKCRIGMHDSNSTNYYELMIGINKSAGISNFAEQMLKYVRAIR